MPCNHVKVGDNVAIICTRRGPRRLCKHPDCGAWVTKECDYPVPERRSRTCDTGFCDQHGVNVGPNKDHCWKHAALPAPQEELTV